MHSHISIGLKAVACLCYQVDKYTYAHILDSTGSDLSNTPDNDEVLVKLSYIFNQKISHNFKVMANLIN